MGPSTLEVKAVVFQLAAVDPQEAFHLRRARYRAAARPEFFAVRGSADAHRACGQIDIGNAATEMTERMTAGVPQANGTTLVEPRMHVRHVAEAVVYMASLPLDTNVQFMTVMATKMPFIGRG